MARGLTRSHHAMLELPRWWRQIPTVPIQFIQTTQCWPNTLLETVKNAAVSTGSFNVSSERPNGTVPFRKWIKKRHVKSLRDTVIRIIPNLRPLSWNCQDFHFFFLSLSLFHFSFLSFLFSLFFALWNWGKKFFRRSFELCTISDRTSIPLPCTSRKTAYIYIEFLRVSLVTEKARSQLLNQPILPHPPLFTATQIRNSSLFTHWIRI